jgi:predicted choloylglycine hydrolase
MDRHEVEQKIFDKNIDSREKCKDMWEYYYPRLLIYIKSFKKILDAEQHDVVSDILLKVFNNLHKYNQLYSLSTTERRFGGFPKIFRFCRARKNAVKNGTVL